MRKAADLFTRRRGGAGFCLLLLLLSILFLFSRRPASPVFPEEVLALAAAGSFQHPLLYDPSLGMFGQSDHVGMRYPFAPAALAQPVPPPLVAAGLQPDPSPPPALDVSKTVVHHHPDARDANARMAAGEGGTLWVAYTSFREGDEEVYIRPRSAEGNWGDEVRLSRHPLADFHPTLGVDGKGGVWVVWNRQEGDGQWPLLGRYYDGASWGPEEVLAAGKHYFPVLCGNPRSGDLWLAWEDWSSGSSRIHTRYWDGQQWSPPTAVSSEGTAQQRPALACGRDGTVWLAFDVVIHRKYDVRLARWHEQRWQVQPDPPALEGHRRRPALAVDPQGRVWMLPETLVIEPIEIRRAFYGQEVLYNLRPPARAMLVWTGSDWKALPPGPALSAKAPGLHIDQTGSLWVFGRTPGPDTGDFLAVGQRYRGEHWYAGRLPEGAWDGNPARTHFVLGGPGIRSTKEPVSLVELQGRLWVAWHETQRKFVWEPAWTYSDGPVDTILHELEIEGAPAEELRVVEFKPTYHGTAGPDVTPLPQGQDLPPEREVLLEGRRMKVYYGDLHHHTEFSRDPGVLNDDVEGNYRYLRDVRQLDFQGLADHTEHLNEHDWYRIRRAAAFYNSGTQFATFVAFEWTSEFYRGGNYQEGHHNVVHRTDGPEARYYSASLPESNTPLRLTQRLEEDLARARQQNLEANVFLFPHDPSRWVQPITWSWYNPRIRLLELVQSRGSHEILGGPQKTPLRNDIQQLVGKSAQDGLERGFRWGFIGSGDHFGRPVAAVFSPSGDRESLFDSLFARRTFATTGARMVVNFSVNGHRMGTEWKGAETEHQLEIYALGTRPITLVEVWKNGRLLRRWSPDPPEREFRLQFEDPSAPYLRENWWYVRVTQEDGEMAWSSPVWFAYTGIDPVVIADAGRRQPNYIVPHFPVPVPILMRNQKEEPVRGTLGLRNLPAAWRLEPEGEIRFELPPESWTTYVWYVRAPAESIGEMKALPVELEVRYDNGSQEVKPLAFVQIPKLLQTRGQLSELNDALHLQDDIGILNRWLQTMWAKWGRSD